MNFLKNTSEYEDDFFSGAEVEICERIAGRYKREGYRLPALPPITLSFEAPPMFILYPDLEQERSFPDDSQKNKELPLNIESVLGQYFTKSGIILYIRGIKWFADKFRLNVLSLRTVVLIHELGHWISHVLTKPGTSQWRVDHFCLSEKDMLEGWAQLFTWWITREEGSDLKAVFDELNKMQSSVYKVYKRFLHLDESRMTESLFYLRGLDRPARQVDWEQSVFLSISAEDQIFRYFKILFSKSELFLPGSIWSISPEAFYLRDNGYPLHGFLRIFF